MATTSVPLTLPQLREQKKSRSALHDTWRRFRRNTAAVIGLAIIAFLLFIAVFVPYLAPYDYAKTDLDNIEAPPSAAHWFGTDQIGRDMLSRLMYGARSVVIVIVVTASISLTLGLILGAAAGFLNDPYYSIITILGVEWAVITFFYLKPFSALPNSLLWLALGILSFVALTWLAERVPYVLLVWRIIAAVLIGYMVWQIVPPQFLFIPTNLAQQVVSTAVAIAIGVLAFWGPAHIDLDTLISRFVDFLLAFPELLFIFFIAATIKPGMVGGLRTFAQENNIAWLSSFVRSGYADYLVVIITLSFLGWAGLARLVRGQVLALRNKDFILSAQAVGVSNWGIITRHLIPNSLSPLLVAISMSLGFIALSEGILAYLGIGLQPPNPSWGNIIADNAGRYWRTFPENLWLLGIPFIIIVSVVFAFNFIGDGLNEALNPELQ